MKTVVAALCALFCSAPVFADGEFAVITCTSATDAGRILQTTVCLSSEDNIAIPCPGQSEPYVTIERSTILGKQIPDLIERISVPASLFAIVWEDDLFSLKLDVAEVGTMDLSHLKGEVDGEDSWKLNIKDFKHSFKAVRCDFESN